MHICIVSYLPLRAFIGLYGLKTSIMIAASILKSKFDSGPSFWLPLLPVKILSVFRVRNNDWSFLTSFNVIKWLNNLL